MSNRYRFLQHQFKLRPEPEVLQRSRDFLDLMRQRRTFRDFSDQNVPLEVIQNAIQVAGSAPSGANMQPWHFVAVSKPEIKRDIRINAEAEEKELYDHRASDEWLDALAPLGTNADKPFLETAPWLIAVFAQKYTLDADGRKRKHYYTPESVGIATGMLIAALHYAGLVTLTHTPSPMGFLRTVLRRPVHEKPFLLLVTGYPADDAMLPDIEKKAVDSILDVI